MTDKDLNISAVGMNQSGIVHAAGGLGSGIINKKPCYLVALKPKNKKPLNFIALDKPDLLEGFVGVKGVFSTETEEMIINQYNTILESVKKTDIADMMFPIHKVEHIRSLVFNANKIR
jgi:hypothetical protein